MALVYYPFEGRDSTITTGDNRKTGITVTVAAIKTLAASPATVSTGQATIVEVGLGAYEVAYDPEANGDAVIALDLSATLSNPGDRYVNIATTREPGRTNTALPAVAAGAAGGLPTATNSSGQVVASSVVGNVGGSVASVTAPVTVTGITAAIMQQLSAFAGSSSVSGNVITYTSQDGLHTFTQTFSPSIAAPTAVAWAQLT